MTHSEILKELKDLLLRIQKEKRTGCISFKLFANQGGIRDRTIIKEEYLKIK